ncbi:YqxA family protein [Bacillus sp. 165]|uniref:YqxA family protein n=1 Tax=Bacillus sp. 165 TaxID=1529117 RepID=UPI001ADB958B|nr:YqxA family protein [Bacillus sp. 165]MBO9129582.1 YqxA family protein [Bacillus sp. 165]
MIRCLLLLTVLFIGVLLGMQLANDGLKKMKGYDDPTFEQVAKISGTESGDMKASFLGKNITIEEKQKKLEKLKSFNLFSKMGDALAGGVEKVVQISTNTVVGKIKDIFVELNKI